MENPRETMKNIKNKLTWTDIKKWNKSKKFEDKPEHFMNKSNVKTWKKMSNMLYNGLRTEVS